LQKRFFESTVVRSVFKRTALRILWEIALSPAGTHYDQFYWRLSLLIIKVTKPSLSHPQTL